jgi:hypothetical protein
MRTYGAVLGVPFGFEEIFFLEAIFTGIPVASPGWAARRSGTAFRRPAGLKCRWSRGQSAHLTPLPQHNGSPGTQRYRRM